MGIDLHPCSSFNSFDRGADMMTLFSLQQSLHEYHVAQEKFRQIYLEGAAKCCWRDFLLDDDTATILTVFLL